MLPNKDTYKCPVPQKRFRGQQVDEERKDMPRSSGRCKGRRNESLVPGGPRG